jgi:hypothetical protein
MSGCVGCGAGEATAVGEACGGKGPTSLVVGDGPVAGGWGASVEGGTNSLEEDGLGAADCIDGALGSAPVGRSKQYLELFNDLLLLVGAGLAVNEGDELLPDGT